MSKRPGRQSQQTPQNLAEALRRIEKAHRNKAADLWLDNLGLTQLPDSIGELSQLQVLYLNGNRLTALPESIGQLSQLQVLFLDDNQLAELPESISELSQLRVLLLDNNQLAALPESLLNLKQLGHLYLHGNPSLGLPAEVLGPSWRENSSAHARPAEILEYYFRAREAGRRPLNEAKLILVGRGEVGKTSVVNRLVHKKFRVERKTEGIKITEWHLKLGRKKEEVRLNVWDFGGRRLCTRRTSSS